MIKKLFNKFKEFAMRGNVMDMAVGIIIGAAFGTIVKSLVADMMMPPIGLLMGDVDFANLFFNLKNGDPAGPYAALAAAKDAGAVSLNYGVFINNILSCIIVAFALFMVIRGMNQLKQKEKEEPAEATTKECAYCFSTIAIKATRCPNCTSEVA